MFESSPDSTECFLNWLRENGAGFPKLSWPSVDTVGGCRGARALEDIAPGEHMIEIPIKLMMSPPHAFRDPVIGPILKASEDLLQGDLLLTVYIMFEMSKGEASFYYPYLQCLPGPGSVSQWTDSQLAELENGDLIHKAKNKLISLRNTYSRTIVKLCNTYPNELPLEPSYSYDKFLFAWYSVQARAFGKRLRWTAMVPYADCLNHGNLQTKYDYNVDGNGFFRLFPSGQNRYLAGTEVFNSYGRRNNDNLLMDYGFAMLDNEWEKVEVLLTLPSTDENFGIKRTLLFTLLGLHSQSTFFLERNTFPLDALSFLRVAHLDENELNTAQEMADGIAGQQQLHRVDNLDMLGIRQCSSTSTNLLSTPPSSVSPPSLFFSTAYVFSLHNELKATRALIATLSQQVLTRVSSIEHDDELISQLTTPPNGSRVDGGTDHSDWRKLCAVTYRTTRKRIQDVTLKRLLALERRLEQANQKVIGQTDYDELIQYTQTIN